MSRTAAIGIPKLDAGPQKSVRMLIEGIPSEVRSGESCRRDDVRVEQK